MNNIQNKKINTRGISFLKTKNYSLATVRGGYAVLFAVLLVSIILSITIGIANVSLKELNFTATSKESHFALFAADTGGECALYANKNGAFSDPGHPDVTLDCDTQQATASFNNLNNSYDFNTGIPVNGGCARVKVTLGTTETIISAYGYNVPCNKIPPVSANNRVERVLTYVIDNSGGTTTGGGTGNNATGSVGGNAGSGGPIQQGPGGNTLSL